MFNKLILLLISLISISLNAQKDSISIVFYNVENLFDNFDDPTKNDNEFLPDSKKEWTSYRWNDKTNKIAKIITALKFPDIIGLAEIENDTVLRKLVKNRLLWKQNYEIIHFESKDRRGIDCALLYKPSRVDLLSLKATPVKLNGRPTRDILGATFITHKDTLALFVNHWPSRYGGRKKSNPKRIQAAWQLKYLMDSVTSHHKNFRILSMGDFNDEPKDSSLKLLSAYINSSLNFRGTIKYRKKWQVFDQFIHSQNLIPTCYVFEHEFLFEEDKKYGGLKLKRTYLGPFYNGGFSDHLPIVLKY